MINTEKLIKELVKNGYSKQGGSKEWDMSNLSLLYLNDNMAKDYLKLKKHPRYKATVIDIETNLLKQNINEVIDCVSECSFNLIDTGASEGEKAKILIKALGKGVRFRYCPVHVNNYLINLATESVKNDKFSNVIDYSPRICDDFSNLDEVGAALRSNNYSKNVFLILNSLLGGYEINEFLFKLSRSMLPGDTIVIGNGIRKGERFEHLENYKSPLFNNWFIHLMKELGFNEDEVEYDARFTNERMESFFTLKVDKEINGTEKKMKFNKGDKIIVASLYKYYADELEKFCKMYFSSVKIFKDKDEEYALVVCKK